MLWLVNRRGVVDVWFTFVFSRTEEAAAGSDCKVSRIYGVVGIIRLLAGESPNFKNYELLRIRFFVFCFFACNSVLLCCNII